MNTKKHNQRKRRRGYKNLFWLVRSTRIGSNLLELYNKKPYKVDYSYSYISEYYYDKSLWYSCHGVSYPDVKLLDRFSITYDDIVPVELVIDNDSPDMFIQRKGDNLFISNDKVRIIKWSFKIITELKYPTRISPKLFPEVTEESGIVGVKIYEKKETKEV
jgi:hypothetical protein